MDVYRIVAQHQHGRATAAETDAFKRWERENHHQLIGGWGWIGIRLFTG